MRTLITNDDGIDSPGLHALAATAVELGLDVVVAAPSWDSSGASSSLTAVEEDGRFVVDRRRIDGLVDTPAFAVEAAPAFITLTAARGAFGPPPQLVLSGINRGLNTGHAVLHSGTVGAAFTGFNHRCRGVAFSMETGADYHWETAMMIARRVVPYAISLDRPMVLNVNLPNVPVEELQGLRHARLATFGAVQANVTEVNHEGYVQLCYSEVEEEFEPGTDAWLVKHGYASITPLLPVCEDDTVPLDGVVDALAVASNGRGGT